MSSIDEIKAEMAAMEQRKQAYMASQKEALGNALRALLEKHPTAKCLAWSQYTPYFNDGDPCTFRANEIHVEIDGVKADGDGPGDTLSPWDIGYRVEQGEIFATPEIKSLHKDLEALNSATSGLDALFLHAFGDHAEVRVTRDGITVEEYEHD